MRAPPLPTTADYVETFAARTPQRPALNENGAGLTYAQLANALLQCGLHLQRLGVRPGERIPVEVDSHVSGVLEHVNGTLTTLTTSFDGVATTAAPILRDYGIPFSVFVVTSWSDGDPRFAELKAGTGLA